MTGVQTCALPISAINGNYGNFPGSPVVKTLVSTAGGGVQSLIEELSYHMWHSVGAKKICDMIVVLIIATVAIISQYTNVSN